MIKRNNKDTTITIRLSKELLKKIMRLSIKYKVTRAEVIRQLLEDSNDV